MHGAAVRGAWVRDAARTAMHGAKRGAMRRWALIGSAAAAVLAVGNLFQPTVVVGNSMLPNLKSGRVIWVDRFYYQSHKPQPGEVVVFRLKGETYVKRVYRGPGEVVHYLDSDGEWVAPIRETRVPEMLTSAARRNRSTFRVKALVVPENSVFVLGDNINFSEDSRNFGPVPLSAVIGRAHVNVDCTNALKYEIAPHKSITSVREEMRKDAAASASRPVLKAVTGRSAIKPASAAADSHSVAQPVQTARG